MLSRAKAWYDTNLEPQILSKSMSIKFIHKIFYDGNIMYKQNK